MMMMMMIINEDVMNHLAGNTTWLLSDNRELCRNISQNQNKRFKQ